MLIVGTLSIVHSCNKLCYAEKGLSLHTLLSIAFTLLWYTRGLHQIRCLLVFMSIQNIAVNAPHDS